MTTSAQSKHGGAKVRFPPPFVYLLLTLVGVALQLLVRRLEFPIASSLRIALGVLVGAGGLSVMLSARGWFIRTKQQLAPWTPSPELIVSGIYRYTRNPMYVGMTTFQVGLGLALDNGWIAALAPVSLGLVHFIAVHPEEAYLREKFGESYERYLGSVRRYL